MKLLRKMWRSYAIKTIKGGNFMTSAILKSLFSDEIIFTILKEIASKKKASFKELRNLFNRFNQATNGDELEQVLDQLCEAKLIGVVDSEYRDLNSYYLTAEGAQMARRLEGFGIMGKAASAR
jgi:predicted transcriptional regulator